MEGVCCAGVGAVARAKARAGHRAVAVVSPNEAGWKIER